MTLSAALTTLETSGLIRATQAEAELEYLFRHALSQDAAYESLLKADRKALHLVIAETLERQYPEQLTELASTLAHHFARAEATPRARHYFALAGEAALSNYANAEAERHYHAALDLTESEADRAQRLSGLGEALLRQSKFENADHVWREAITAYQSLGDYAGVARMYARAARTAGTAHAEDKPRALALCREGLTVVDGQPESPALAALLHETGRACFFNGLLDEARSFCQQALTLAEKLEDAETQAETLATLWGLLPVPSPQAAIEGLQRAAELAEAVGRLDTAARIYHNVGFRLGLEHGELRLGQRHIQHALTLLRQIGDEAGQFYTFDVAILLAFLLGDFDEVATISKKMTALLPSAGNRALGVTTLSGWEAWRLRCHGELGVARAAFQTALIGFRQHQAFDTLANMSCTFAEMLLELNDLALAENVLQEVLELVERGFMEPVEPHSLLVAVYARQGRMEAAHQALAKAQQEVGASPGVFSALLLAQAEARLAVAERQWSTAFTAFETARAHAAQHGIRWQHAQTLHEWAEAHLARNEPGDVDRARELLHESLALFEEMNVPKYAALVGDRIQSL